MVEKNNMKYVEEHLTCKNYAIDSHIIEIKYVKKNEYFNYKNTQYHILCFLIEGCIIIKNDMGNYSIIESGKMFMISKSDSLWGKIKYNATILMCYIDATLALCNEYTIKKLINYMPNGKVSGFEKSQTILPINDLLLKELNVTIAAMQTGLLCLHYQKIKRDIFLLYLRGFYTKEELADLFKPIIGEEFDFKQSILSMYTYTINVQELINISGLPPTSFNRKFLKAFGLPPGKWLLEKKKNDILKYLIMTDMPIKEIASKFGFTQNYFYKFCRQYMGDSPAELRNKPINMK